MNQIKIGNRTSGKNSFQCESKKRTPAGVYIIALLVIVIIALTIGK